MSEASSNSYVSSKPVGGDESAEISPTRGGCSSARFGTSQRRKLVFLVTEDWYFCSHRLPLAIAAKAGGYDVTVLTRVSSHGGMIKEAGLNLIPIKMARRGGNLFAELRGLIELIRIYRKLRPDVVHHVALKAVIFGSVAAKVAGVRNVVNAIAGLGWVYISGSRKARVLRKVSTALLRVLLKRGTVVVQNPDDKKLLQKIGVHDRRIALIRGSGVNLGVFAYVPEPEGAPTVVLASRMLWDKGIGEFVEAAKKITHKGVNARFVLVGGPDPLNPASIAVDTLNHWHESGVIEWWGPRTDMPVVFQQANIVCLPSYREGLPKVLIEAAACGRAIVTTNTPGCKEIVRDRDNGLLVPARNSRTLADSLEELIRNRALRERMGARGRFIAAHEFSIESVVSETLEVYEELLTK